MTTRAYNLIQSRWRRSVAVRPAQLSLTLLGLLLLMLPVSYKAGTDTSHEHSVFVVIWDDIRGTQHSHGEHVAERPQSALLSLEIPLSTIANTDDLDANLPPIAGTPAAAEFQIPDDDIPHLTGVRFSAEFAGMLATLAVAVLLLFQVQLIRKSWGVTTDWVGQIVRVPFPPPQPAC